VLLCPNPLGPFKQPTAHLKTRLHLSQCRAAWCCPLTHSVLYGSPQPGCCHSPNKHSAVLPGSSWRPGDRQAKDTLVGTSAQAQRLQSACPPGPPGSSYLSRPTVTPTFPLHHIAYHTTTHRPARNLQAGTPQPLCPASAKKFHRAPHRPCTTTRPSPTISATTDGHRHPPFVNLPINPVNLVFPDNISAPASLPPVADSPAMADANANDELYPIAVLIDELKVIAEPQYSGAQGPAVGSCRAPPAQPALIVNLVFVFASTTMSCSVSTLSTACRPLPSLWAPSAPETS